MSKICSFGKCVKKRLIDLDQSQEWLIKQVHEDTGLFFDSGYMGKILTGSLSTPRIIESICKILKIKDEKEGT